MGKIQGQATKVSISRLHFSTQKLIGKNVVVVVVVVVV